MGYQEIADEVGLSGDVKFTSEEEVRDYFRLDVMRDMFGEEWGQELDDHGDVVEPWIDDETLQGTLDFMADEIIEHRWDCDFNDGVGFVATFDQRGSDDRFRMWFASEAEMWRGLRNLRRRGYSVDGEIVTMTKDQFSTEERGELVQSLVPDDPEPFGWAVSPD